MTSFLTLLFLFSQIVIDFGRKVKVSGESFSQNIVYFGRRKIYMGEKFSRCKSAGYPPAKFYGHDTLYIVVANCSYPRTASGHHGGEQCGPQLLLWYSVPASCTPYIAGGSEGTLCLPSASGCHSHASQPAVLPPVERLVFSRKTLSPAPQALDSRGVHKELLVAVASFIPPTAKALCRSVRRC